jgi:hypothetical protein
MPKDPKPQPQVESFSALRNPIVSLPAFGHVLDQATGKEILYDPKRITTDLQTTLLSYLGNPPKNELGHNRWLCLLGYRQGGKSLCAELGAYALTAYTPGHDHVCIADTKHRADYLHQRVHFNHKRWDEKFRSPTVPNRESRQLTFDSKFGGRMRTLSAESGAVGIGQSPDSVHISEIGFFSSPGTIMNLMLPSIINREHATAVVECTPVPSGAPGARYWQDLFNSAKRGKGRWLAAFFPFWDNKLAQRPWPLNSKPDKEELELYEQYHTKGLTWENLAFRREMMEADAEIRRNPDLFRTFYPFDSVSCWMATAGGVIHKGILEKHIKSPLLIPWNGPFQEYEAPEAGAIYAIGVDPAGFGAGDHASFQVLKVWKDEWTQVACFSDNEADPVSVAERLVLTARRYNNAYILVESNGVGAAVLAILQTKNWENLYYHDKMKPGIPATSKSIDEGLANLLDALMDNLKLYDEDLVQQLMTYKNDKKVQDSDKSLMLRGKVGRHRREKHHYDKVSALIWAAYAARDLPQRSKPGENEEVSFDNVIPFDNMAYNARQEYLKEVEKSTKTKSRKSKYRSTRMIRNKKRRRRD